MLQCQMGEEALPFAMAAGPSRPREQGTGADRPSGQDRHQEDSLRGAPLSADTILMASTTPSW